LLWGTPVPSLRNVIVAVLFHRNGDGLRVSNNSIASAALIGKTVGQLVVFRFPPPEVKTGLPELTPLRHFCSRAGLLDIFEIVRRGHFSQKRAAIGDPLRKWALVLAPPIGVTIATATAAARLTLGATRHRVPQGRLARLV